ncbi:MAG: tyrosine-type recombinase/integrase, partial [Magnetococcales bacterium]|nr:tyrosine-type recombinase/integrase [Magnetococcales bacterium]
MVSKLHQRMAGITNDLQPGVKKTPLWLDLRLRWLHGFARNEGWKYGFLAKHDTSNCNFIPAFSLCYTYCATDCLLIRLVLELLYTTGMRVGELVTIRDDDVDVDEGVIKLFGKG